MTRVEQRVAMVRAAVAAGDDEAAAVVLDLMERDAMLSPELALELVPSVWDRCGAPMLVLSVASWVGLFRRAGYTHDFEPAPQPTEPVRLYRGSDPAGELGMCWSTNPDVARWLASRFPDGRVWSAVVEPERLLAFVAPLYEDQYVVDTTWLRPVLFEGPDVVAALDLDGLFERLDLMVEDAAARGCLP